MILKIVQVDVRENETRIVWSDGHSGVYQHKFLRESCPCAGCKGEPGLFGKVYLPLESKVSDEVKPKEFGQVGRYGISISWSDGHSTGIYEYSFLRELCQCNQCKS